MDLFTDPSARGKGVARADFGGVHAAAKQDGIPTTYWNTQDTITKARMLYDQIATLTPFLTYEKTDRNRVGCALRHHSATNRAPSAHFNFKMS